MEKIKFHKRKHRESRLVSSTRIDHVFPRRKYRKVESQKLLSQKIACWTTLGLVGGKSYATEYIMLSLNLIRLAISLQVMNSNSIHNKVCSPGPKLGNVPLGPYLSFMATSGPDGTLFDSTIRFWLIYICASVSGILSTKPTSLTEISINKVEIS